MTADINSKHEAQFRNFCHELKTLLSFSKFMKIFVLVSIVSALPLPVQDRSKTAIEIASATLGVASVGLVVASRYPSLRDPLYKAGQEYYEQGRMLLGLAKNPASDVSSAGAQNTVNAAEHVVTLESSGLKTASEAGVLAPIESSLFRSTAEEGLNGPLPSTELTAASSSLVASEVLPEMLHKVRDAFNKLRSLRTKAAAPVVAPAEVAVSSSSSSSSSNPAPALNATEGSQVHLMTGAGSVKLSIHEFLDLQQSGLPYEQWLALRNAQQAL